MAKAKLLYQNRAEGATASASSSNAGTAASQLVTPNRRKVWRAVSGINPVSFTLDLGAAYDIDVVAVLETNLTAAGTRRVRLSNASNFSPTTYDSTAEAPAEELNTTYKQLVHLLPSTVTSRYIKVDLDDAAVSYHEAGLAIAGALTQVGRNYKDGWSWLARDLSEVAQSVGGATYVSRRPILRGLDLLFESLTHAEGRGLATNIATINGNSRPILVVLDPASTDLGRDTIWGLPEGELAVVFSNSAVSALRLRVFERY